MNVLKKYFFSKICAFDFLLCAFLFSCTGNPEKLKFMFSTVLWSIFLLMNVGMNDIDENDGESIA